MTDICRHWSDGVHMFRPLWLEVERWTYDGQEHVKVRRRFSPVAAGPSTTRLEMVKHCLCGRAVRRLVAPSGPGDTMGNPCPLCRSMDRYRPSSCIGGFHLGPGAGRDGRP